MSRAMNAKVKEESVSMVREAIPFCSFGGYRPFTSYWWSQLWRYLIRGWYQDIYTYWHRARYGWAPRDTWNLDHSLNRVLAGTLTHLAEHCNGAPAGYPRLKNRNHDKTDFKRWEYDLKRWGRAFEDLNWWEENDIYFPRDDNDPNWYQNKLMPVEQFFAKRAEKALKEMAPWWQALWD